ncbi:MAG: NUDIX domain-containing protein [Gammaproteobacteria bacterium]|nr:NUDIX domain-containing protein [Gammaproteobacteria bacterium]
MKWRLINRQPVFSGFFKVDKCQIQHDLYAGGEIEISRELFHRGDAVAALLYDPVKDKVVMIEQFRVGAIADEQGPWLLEIVAGVIEEGESPRDVARRECLEEAGLEVHAFETIHTFYSSPGGCSEKIFLLCGLVDSDKADGVHGLPDEGEDIKVSVVDYDEVKNLLGADQISSAIPIIALQWLQINRERLRIESFVM